MYTHALFCVCVLYQWVKVSVWKILLISLPFPSLCFSNQPFPACDNKRFLLQQKLKGATCSAQIEWFLKYSNFLHTFCNTGWSWQPESVPEFCLTTTNTGKLYFNHANVIIRDRLIEKLLLGPSGIDMTMLVNQSILLIRFQPWDYLKIFIILFCAWHLHKSWALPMVR